MLFATIAGNIGRDAETRQAGGNTVTNFSVAVEQRGRGGDKTTTWVRCAIWGQRGDKLRSYLTKGSKVCVAGELTVGMYDGKPQVDLNVSEVTLMGGKPERDDDRQEAPRRQSKLAQADLDDDIPF